MYVVERHFAVGTTEINDHFIGAHRRVTGTSRCWYTIGSGLLPGERLVTGAVDGVNGGEEFVGRITTKDN